MQRRHHWATPHPQELRFGGRNRGEGWEKGEGGRQGEEEGGETEEKAETIHIHSAALKQQARTRETKSISLLTPPPQEKDFECMCSARGDSNGQTGADAGASERDSILSSTHSPHTYTHRANFKTAELHI